MRFLVSAVPGRVYQILSFLLAMGAAVHEDSTTASIFMAACFVIITVRDIERERRNAR